MVLARATPPKTWDDIVAFVEAADFSDPNLTIPEWVVEVPMELAAAPGARTVAVADVPATEVGVVCATGTFPDFTIHDGGTFAVGG